MKRYNVSQAKQVPGRDKPVWLKHGVAFERDGKVRVKLESLPIPNQEGEIWLSLFEDDGTRGLTAAPADAPAEGFDDEIPF
jgi:hypothetical protein